MVIHGLLLYRNYRNSDVTKTRCPRYTRSSVSVIYILKAPCNKISKFQNNFTEPIAISLLQRQSTVSYAMRKTVEMMEMFKGEASLSIYADWVNGG